ncbi:MAG: 30S ribosome-binding factor RbfA [Patescibacteria group bacterium]|mgnify:CR=1 FL=1
MSQRPSQVAELVKRQLSKLFLKSLPEEMGLITITNVVISSDCRKALVYISCFNCESEKEVLKVIEENRQEFQAILGKKLRMKFPPKLEFKIDKSLKDLARLENIFQKINHNDS